MAYSKTFLLVGLVLAVLLVISSEVSARELAETQENMQMKSVEENGYGHEHGHEHEHEHEHGHGKPGHGGHPPNGAGETKEVETESNHGYEHGYGHGHEHGHGHGHGKPGHGGHPPKSNQN